MFTLFKKRRDNNTILKMFRVVTKEQAFGFDTKLLIDIILKLLEENFKTAPSNYYITGPYPDEGWETKNGFLKAVERKHFKNICHLILSTDVYSFSFQNWILNDINPKDLDYQAIEFSVNERLCDYEKMEDIYRVLATAFSPNYAFIFKLPSNYMPSTESKIKDGFFSYSLATNPKENIWRQYIYKVDKAVLKDIYPINFINDAVLNSHDLQENIVSKNIGTLAQNKNGLSKWTLDSNEITIAKERLANSDLLLKVIPA
ncbi:MAG: hypothetical protein V4685_16465 [Bacteroidota bacterium]